MTHVQRYGRAARWFHAAVYVTVLVALGTGWWFVLNRYERPLLGLPDTAIHELAGLLFALVCVVQLVLRFGAVRAFLRESLQHDDGDVGWFRGWPKALVTGRFPRHGGRYDPGQRLANLVILGTLATIALTGFAMLLLSLPQPWADLMVDLHTWATFIFTPVVLGHVVIASGVLPGYRGVWRSMHLGGRLPREVAERIWPEWAIRQ